MSNSEVRALKWANFIAGRKEFEARDRFLAAFKAGRISRICDCGCNSFDIELPEGKQVAPLTTPGSYGAVFEIEFRTDEEDGTMEFVVLANADGHLAAVEVNYCANSFAVPDEPTLIEPPYHVWSSASMAA